MKTSSTFWLSLQQSVNVKSPRQIQTSSKPTISCFGVGGGSTHTRLTPFQYWWDQEWKVESERWGREGKERKDHKREGRFAYKMPVRFARQNSFFIGLLLWHLSCILVVFYYDTFLNLTSKWQTEFRIWIRIHSEERFEKSRNEEIMHTKKR